MSGAGGVYKPASEGLSKYYAEISYMDQQVGEVVDILREMKQAENTVILWLSEQGSQLPFGKWTCYDMGHPCGGRGALAREN